MKNTLYIFYCTALLLLISCSGSKKYFKAAEKLEKQGLVNEAAEYYLQSLQRKITNVEARIKLKEVGQKCVSNMASDFFRNYNTNQLEASLNSFEKLKEFTNKTAVLNVTLDYPKQYDEDYQKVVESYCSKNHDIAFTLVNQGKYSDAVTYINKVNKYNPTYKTTQQLEVIAVCEPIYQAAVVQLGNKNYTNAYNLLSKVNHKSPTYKDTKDLYELASEGQTKHFMLFEPKKANTKTEKDLEDYLFNNFNQIAVQKFTFAKVINNTPFNYIPDVSGGKAADVDLIQAIRKATGADYFYSYDITDIKEINSGPKKITYKAFQEIKTKKNDTTIIISYKQVDYNVVQASRAYNYMYNYKLINAVSNQIISSQSQQVNAQDAVEYNEFVKTYGGNINQLYPYNPEQTAPAARYNPNKWRQQFNANSNLKSFDVLKEEANNKAIDLFTKSILNNMK
ncbi:MAG: hypothetical protein IPM51_08100 [Sphingobacteriaceae bacterium]|nr:hypothetical protein [Sphingobacteriaceae bacterium]